MEDSILSKKISILATGRRKTAIAQITLTDGSGEFTINGKEGVVYLQENAFYIGCVKAPLSLLKLEEFYDFKVKV